MMNLRDEIYCLSDGDKECVEKPVKSSIFSESEPTKLLKSMIKVSSFENISLFCPSCLEFSMRQRKKNV